MTLSDVVELCNITNEQAQDLYSITGSIPECFRYALLLGGGISIEDIRWLVTSKLFRVFNDSDWRFYAGFIQYISHSSGSDPAEVLKSLLSYSDYKLKVDDTKEAVSYLLSLRDKLANYEVEKSPSLRYIRTSSKTPMEKKET